MKKIKDLIDCSYDIEITGITDDSRLVEKGYLFVATKGFNVDHYDYIDDAIKKGCSFVICDRKINKNIPHLVVENINDLFFELCRRFYDLDLNKFNFIGITGTDGKTTTATIVNKLIDGSAYIGTNGLSVDDKTFSTSNTTPCVSELYKDLKIVEKNDSSTVVMEVSSEALLHDRVKGLEYKIIGFTNITGDHLNVHKTFENYVKCKMKLLDLLEDDGIVIVNGDDKILHDIKCKNMYTFGFDSDNNFVITNVAYNEKNTIITINDSIIIDSPLVGKYNVYNVVMAYLIGKFFGVDDCLLLNRIKELSPIKGRCEFLDFGQNFDIVLDYAHTTNGIKCILDAFSDYDNIIVVTGCAGGREKTKRRDIGKLIMDKSDIAIFTMDDPRYENVDEIINQMVLNDTDYIRIIDRREAIKYALSIATPSSVVLILGKGRDDYMAIKDEKIKYCDYDVICDFYKGKE